MCGITGISAFNEIGRIQMIHLPQATQALQKRGPDFQDTLIDYWVALGHARLSILDTSHLGHQPMQDASGRYTIVFNGEIYNYAAIRQKLLNKGVHFSSQTDTEVLLQLFIHEKEKCLDALNGFFAFAVYDKEEQSLFLARDRMGIKPLLYYQSDDVFLFASEMKSLLAYGIDKNMDYESLTMYLQFNYIAAPSTIFKNVRKLPAGHYLWVKNSKVSCHSYYQIENSNTENRQHLDYKTQQKQLHELLADAVQKRMIADVPLGAFLSGGIDSSIMVALASSQTQHLKTFSIGYQDQAFFDETHYAQLVAEKFKTDHTTFMLSNQDLYESLHHVLDYIDEPFADSSALAVYILSRQTRKHVTVALSGDGADELFAGYHKHAGEFRIREGGIMASIIKLGHPIWKILPQSRNNAIGNLFRQFYRFSEGARLSPRERYWLWAGFLNIQKARSYLSPSSLEKWEQEQYLQLKEQHLRYLHDQDQSNRFFNQVLKTDTTYLLPNDMLSKVDSMSMANSLEVRVPFLDHRVVEFAFSLPTESKIDRHMKKKILQDTFRDLLPKELYQRPKQGFEVPMLKWLRTTLKSTLENELLADSFIREQGIFNPSNLQKLKNKLYSRNPGDSHATIWALLIFQSWWKKYMN